MAIKLKFTPSDNGGGSPRPLDLNYATSERLEDNIKTELYTVENIDDAPVAITFNTQNGISFYDGSNQNISNVTVAPSTTISFYAIIDKNVLNNNISRGNSTRLFANISVSKTVQSTPEVPVIDTYYEFEVLRQYTFIKDETEKDFEIILRKIETRNNIVNSVESITNLSSLIDVVVPENTFLINSKEQTKISLKPNSIVNTNTGAKFTLNNNTSIPNASIPNGLDLTIKLKQAVREEYKDRNNRYLDRLLTIRTSDEAELPRSIVVTLQPTSVSTTQGGTATFTTNAIVQNDPTAIVNYTWEINSGAGYVEQGETTNTLTLSNLPIGSATVRCKITSGNLPTVLTNAVNLTVAAPEQVIRPNFTFIGPRNVEVGLAGAVSQFSVTQTANGVTTSVPVSVEYDIPATISNFITVTNFADWLILGNNTGINTINILSTGEYQRQSLTNLTNLPDLNSSISFVVRDSGDNIVGQDTINVTIKGTQPSTTTTTTQAPRGGQAGTGGAESDRPAEDAIDNEIDGLRGTRIT